MAAKSLRLQWLGCLACSVIRLPNVLAIALWLTLPAKAAPDPALIPPVMRGEGSTLLLNFGPPEKLTGDLAPLLQPQ